MIEKRDVLLSGYNLIFVARTNVPSPFNVYWKVKNRGYKAKQEDMIHGEIVRTDNLSHSEVTTFKGNHYVECYIVKNGVCVAKQLMSKLKCLNQKGA
ncbi:nucleotide-binding domain-containing protein [Metabacillus sp. FJAT-53654]|uniref:Adenylyl/Guanylyl and SMODS C-terminal sensor domain-containing protein n=1 Tax=Metabacillus rhizosphaerae TaxID=3117747 RepID=A0ABZ2MPJ1_9BACI